MSIALDLDPSTGDLVLDGQGQVAVTETPRPELLLAIAIPLGSVFSDPEQGSEVPGLVSGDDPPDNIAARVAAAAQQAIAPLEAIGLATLESVAFDEAERLLTINVDELPDPIAVEVVRA